MNQIRIKSNRIFIASIIVVIVNCFCSSPNDQLIKAVKENDVPMVDYLLKQGANPNIVEIDKDKLEMPVLAIAADSGFIDILKKLVLNGANVNAISNYPGLNISKSILDYSKNKEIAEILVLHHVSIDSLATFWAVARGDSDLVKYLLNNGSSPNSSMDKIGSCLMLAIESIQSETDQKYLSIIHSLILAGANAFNKNKDGENAFNYAKNIDKTYLFRFLQQDLADRQANLSSSKPIVNNYNVNNAFDEASEFVKNKDYYGAIATYRIIDSMLYQFPLNDTCVSFRAIAVANLSWLYFLTNLYEPSLAYAKTFDEIIAHQNILFADSIMNGHKNQTLYNKIWSNVALGNLKEAINLTGNKGLLGIDDEKVAEGFKITQIRNNSPAYHNHLKIGDILTSFNDIPLINISDDSLINLINSLPRGTRVNISIIRENIKQIGFITIGIIDTSYTTSISK